MVNVVHVDRDQLRGARPERRLVGRRAELQAQTFQVRAAVAIGVDDCVRRLIEEFRQCAARVVSGKQAAQDVQARRMYPEGRRQPNHGVERMSRSEKIQTASDAVTPRPRRRV